MVKLKTFIVHFFYHDMMEILTMFGPNPVIPQKTYTNCTAIRTFIYSVANNIPFIHGYINMYINNRVPVASSSSEASESEDHDENREDEVEVNKEDEKTNDEADEYSVGSEEVNALSSKAKKNNKKNNTKASAAKSKKWGNTTNENTPVKDKKKRKENSARDKDTKVRVEESIIVREKKGINNYAKRNNKLEDNTIIQKDHYRKTINYLLNKKTTAQKELTNLRRNQTVGIKDKQLKDMRDHGVKNSLQSMRTRSTLRIYGGELRII
eukprot:scaffold28992_cov55-Attheya_sp.AAC.1